MLSRTSSHLREISDEAEDPWFVANDVCDPLGIGNISQACEGLEEHETSGICITDTIGRSQMRIAVSESGIYYIIGKSRKRSSSDAGSGGMPAKS